MQAGTDGEAAALLRPTAFIDSDSPAIAALVARVAPEGDPRERVVRLYYAVRDEIRYDPYRIELSPDAFRGSYCLAEGHGFCINKAVLLAAAARAVGVPARLGFADVRNHLATPRLLELTGSDLFCWHGYASLLLEGRWVKATPAFNIALCERFGVRPLEFDGAGDSLLHPFDAEGRRHMEYVAERGLYDDLPYAAIADCFRQSYPRLFSEASGGDFHAEAGDAR